MLLVFGTPTMVNTSATGGYLAPQGTAPVFDDDLARQLQAMVVGIADLDINLVRPRWQPKPPVQPDPSTDWASIGVTRIEGDTYGAVVHSGAGVGSSELRRNETIEALCSFYGPNATAKAAQLRDGLLIGQNREVLRTQGLGLREATDLISMHEAVNNRWVHRVDLTLTLRREVNRTYPIRNILSAEGTIQADDPVEAPVSTTWNTENV